MEAKGFKQGVSLAIGLEDKLAGEVFGNLASQEMEFNNPNDTARRNLDLLKQFTQAGQFQQQQQMAQQQQQLQQIQQSFQNQQQQKAQQFEMSQRALDTSTKLYKIIGDNDDPAARAAILASVAPQLQGMGIDVKAGMQTAQAFNQQKLKQFQTDLLLSGYQTTPPPSTDTQQVDLPPAPFGLAAPSSATLSAPPPPPVGSIGGQPIYRQPPQVNPLQQSEIDRNKALVDLYKTRTTGSGPMSGHTRQSYEFNKESGGQDLVIRDYLGNEVNRIPNAKAPKPEGQPSATERQTLVAATLAANAMETISPFDENSSYSPDLIGPVLGGKKTFSKATYMNDPVSASFLSHVQDVKKLVVQMAKNLGLGSGPRYESYIASLPSENDSEELYKAHWRDTMKNLTEMQQLMARNKSPVGPSLPQAPQDILDILRNFQPGTQ